MFLERNILEPYFLVCTVIIFSPMIAIHVISSYKMADIQEICVQQDLYPFFHDFFLGIRLNSLLEITAVLHTVQKNFHAVDVNKYRYIQTPIGLLIF